MKKIDHNKWLEKQGLLPAQISSKKKTFKSVVSFPDLKTAENYPLGNRINGNGFKTDIMSKLHNETPEVQKAILDKAARTAPAFNKGALQYSSPESDSEDQSFR
jgi:hypothetical protein